mmetsp:Transcript_1833/g.2830  ORF Transcript_1833/g.2830 Transcript_1833/m.2830 type:complete len:82 (+) Transcript_1833:2437-2682(+)
MSQCCNYDNRTPVVDHDPTCEPIIFFMMRQVNYLATELTQNVIFGVQGQPKVTTALVDAFNTVSWGRGKQQMCIKAGVQQK